MVLAFGLKLSQSDHTVFYKNTNLGSILLVVYVDDIVITRSDNKGTDNLKIFLQSQFQTKDMGALKYFLGIEVMYSKKGIPMDPGVKLTVDGVPFSDPQRCKRKVEKLNYLCITRSDISFPVSFVSQFMRFLTNTQWEAFIHIKYLKKALGKGIAYQDHGHI